MSVTPVPAQATQLGADYVILGEYVQDDSRIPFFSPAAATIMWQPGEPMLIQWDTNAGPASIDASPRAVVNQNSPIFPGQTRMLLTYGVWDFPCDLSGNAVLGDEIFWDEDDFDCALEGDVTNGWLLGHATYEISDLPGIPTPTLDVRNRVICAGAASTRMRVMLLGNELTRTVGTPTIN